MGIQIDIPDYGTDTEFTVDVPLEGVPYIFGFSYSQFSDRWFFDLRFVRSATSLEPVILGVPVAIGYPLLTGCAHDSRPPGELIFQGSQMPIIVPADVYHSGAPAQTPATPYAVCPGSLFFAAAPSGRDPGRLTLADASLYYLTRADIDGATAQATATAATGGGGFF